jgi:hypothetical protein
MTSKKLGALLRSVPPATATATEDGPPVPKPEPQAEDRVVTTPPGVNVRGPVPTVESEVPLQVLIPVNVRKQLAIMAAVQGESLRSLILQAIRSLGITVSEAEIKGKRGQKKL